MKSRLPGALLSLVLAALPAAAHADETGPVMTIRLFDTIATWPLPPWATGPADAARSETYRTRQKTRHGTEVFLLELIPPGESFNSWSQLQAIAAERPLAAPLTAHVSGIFADFKAACIPAPTLKPLFISPEHVMILVSCPAYRNNPEQGEMMFMSLRRHDRTLVRLYYHKRGPAFRTDNPAEFPLSANEVDRLIEQHAFFRLGSP